MNKSDEVKPSTTKFMHVITDIVLTHVLNAIEGLELDPNVTTKEEALLRLKIHVNNYMYNDDKPPTKE